VFRVIRLDFGDQQTVTVPTKDVDVPVVRTLLLFQRNFVIEHITEEVNLPRVVERQAEALLPSSRIPKAMVVVILEGPLPDSFRPELDRVVLVENN